MNARAIAKNYIMMWRKWRFGLRHIASTAYIAPGNCDIHFSLIMEEFSFLGTRCIVGPNVRLGIYAMIGPEVAFVGDDHSFMDIGVPVIFTGRPTEVRETRVGADCWIGRGATVLAGVCIGDGTIVGAGAVVTRDLPENSLAAGVPARVIRDRFKHSEDWLRHKQKIYEKTVTSGGHYIAPASLLQRKG
jgi:acetyltransferase-like isoleucine patch superfamily enzyme